MKKEDKIKLISKENSKLNKFFDAMTKEELKGFIKIHMVLQDSKYYTTHRTGEYTISYENLTFLERLRILCKVFKTFILQKPK